MAKANHAGPASKLHSYEELVGSVPGLEREGAANPYTSRNGWMQSFLDQDGSLSIRLGKKDRETFLEKYDTELAVQYGSVMEEFAVAPDRARLLRREEIPLVADVVEEHGDFAVWLRAWFGNKLDACLVHPPIHLIEVVHTEEEPYPSGELRSDGSTLAVAISSSQEEARATSLGPDHHPTLGPPIVGEGRRIFDEVEVEDIHEEGDRLVVVGDDQRQQVEMSH